MYAEIEAHRLVRALHAPGDVQFLEIKMAGYRGWQPSCTIPEAHLTQYFARKADERIKLRRFRAQTHGGTESRRTAREGAHLLVVLELCSPKTSFGLCNAQGKCIRRGSCC